MGETSDGLVETGGDLKLETLEDRILGVHSRQTHQTPVWWNEREEKWTEVRWHR